MVDFGEINRILQIKWKEDFDFENVAFDEETTQYIARLVSHYDELVRSGMLEGEENLIQALLIENEPDGFLMRKHVKERDMNAVINDIFKLRNRKIEEMIVSGSYDS